MSGPKDKIVMKQYAVRFYQTVYVWAQDEHEAEDKAYDDVVGDYDDVLDVKETGEEMEEDFFPDSD